MGDACGLGKKRVDRCSWGFAKLRPRHRSPTPRSGHTRGPGAIGGAGATGPAQNALHALGKTRSPSALLFCWYLFLCLQLKSHKWLRVRKLLEHTCPWLMDIIKGFIIFIAGHPTECLEECRKGWCIWEMCEMIWGRIQINGKNCSKFLS